MRSWVTQRASWNPKPIPIFPQRTNLCNFGQSIRTFCFEWESLLFLQRTPKNTSGLAHRFEATALRTVAAAGAALQASVPLLQTEVAFNAFRTVAAVGAALQASDPLLQTEVESNAKFARTSANSYF